MFSCHRFPGVRPSRQSRYSRLAVTTSRPRRSYTPVDRPGTIKYSPAGMFRSRYTPPTSVGLQSHTLSSIIFSAVSALNCSVTQQTWSGYYTATRHLTACQQATGVSMVLPLNSHQLAIYVGYLFKVVGVTTGTNRNYLSGLRMAHLSQGFADTLHSPGLDLLITGYQNIQNQIGSATRRTNRRSVTFPLLRLLGDEISRSSWSPYKQRLVWSVSLMAMFGAFCLGELLSVMTLSFVHSSRR